MEDPDDPEGPTIDNKDVILSVTYPGPGTLDAAAKLRLDAWTTYRDSGEAKQAELALAAAEALVEADRTMNEEGIPVDLEGNLLEPNLLEVRNTAQETWTEKQGLKGEAEGELSDLLGDVDLAALRAEVERVTGEWDDINNTLVGYVEAVVEAETARDEAKAARDAATLACQVENFDAYRRTLETRMIERAEKLVEIKKLLATQLAKPEPGTEGARCEKALSNGTYRPARGEEACGEGLCCGAARVWMAVGDGVADAAWRTIETCQSEDTEEYLYQPPRQPMAVDLPDPVSATFTCIEGAKKLAAAASAVAAAVYMLA